jgi:hypothetical protein
MKHLLALAAVFVLTSGPASAQAGGGADDAGKGAPKQKSVARCPAANPDPAYDRRRVLEQLAAVLNDSVPEYRKVYKAGFGVRDQKGLGFFVYDLTDTSNKGTPLYDCVNFLNRHVYHFAAINLHYSYSHLAFLEDGRVKVFKSVNCPERGGDRIEDVINYLDRALRDDENKREVISRVRDYRKYGLYVGVDPQSALRCEAAPR